MKSILAVLTARWFVTLLAALVLAALVWFYGPLLAFGGSEPLKGEMARLITMMAITFIWGASNLFSMARQRRANAQMVDAMKAPPEPKGGPADDELRELEGKLDGALDKLKGRKLKGRFGNAWLYQLPWYAIIGPPGSGKTTAILQSGLRFPLADRDDEREIRGVGGTRNCDWFFTEEAVLIDTAGRYTTQESHRDADEAGWLGFLDLLRKFRRRQPLNGVIVAISLADVLGGDPAMVKAHAKAIRARLAELAERLDVRFPVYVMFTKADLVAGFDAFFDDLGEHEREQVWGMTFPHDPAGAGNPVEQAGAEFDLLRERIAARTLERLEAERDLESRAAIFGFEGELAALRQPLLSFLDSVFYASDFQARVDLRGLYFTSATQEGTPIDRLMRQMAGTLGMTAPPPQSTRGNRSFFITRLLRDVIFEEAGLVSHNPKLERRERWVTRLAWGAAAAALLLAGAGWYWSYAGNRDRTVAFAQDLARYAQAAQGPGQIMLERKDADLRPIIEPLAILRDLPAGHAAASLDEPLLMRLGLSQRAALSIYAEVAYERGLVRLFLPRLVLRLEDQLWSNITEPDYVLEALKAYLMLGGEAPLDPDHVRTIIDVLDWQPAFARESDIRDQLLGHLDVLLARLPDLREKPLLDPQLIERARQTIRQLPLARRAYDELLGNAAIQGLPEWRPLDHAGPNAVAVLTRRSGRPLNQGVPGAFTYDGFHFGILPLLADAASEVAVEGWVLGSAAGDALDERQLARLQDDMLALYYDDYIEAWENQLSDITLQPLGDLRQAAEQIKALAGPSSPLKLVMQAILDETKLAVPPPEPEEGAEGGAGLNTKAASKMGLKALGKVGAKAKKLAKLVKPGSGGGGAAGAEPDPPGQPVQDHFLQLAALVEGVGGAPPVLDEALAALGAMQAELQQIVLSPNPDQALLQRGGLAAVAQPVAQAAARLPEPLAGVVQGIARTVAGKGRGAARRQLNAIWQAEVLPFCRQAIDGRYPFVRASPVDVSLADFARLFGPGGLIEQFTNTHLVPLIDTSGGAWRFTGDIGIPDASLRPFARARAIRDSLFAGGALPQASFSIRPVALDAAASQVVLDLDGQQASYAHGPLQPVSMRWPGPNGTNIVRLSFTPLGGGRPLLIAKEGAWSWFRLLHEASFTPTGLPELFHVTFGAGPHRASFELRAASVSNPFNLGLLEQFRCPEGL